MTLGRDVPVSAQVSAQRNYYTDRVELCVFADDGDGPSALQVALGKQQAQRLMDDLWHAGLRPTLATAGDAVLAAKDEHISDLRALVFGQAGQAGGGEGLISALAQMTAAAVAGVIAASGAAGEDDDAAA